MIKKIMFSITLAVTASALILQNTSAATPTLLIGLGPEAIDANKTTIVKEAPIKMLTSWYNGPNDLNWMDDTWHTDFIRNAYAQGYTHHLVTYHEGPEGNFTSSKGPACGRQYPLSAQYISDLEKLTNIYKGNGPIYFTLMTEFQGYPCNGNQWAGNENYFNALKANYSVAVQRIRAINPNAKVSLGWGGWQMRFDNPTTGAGRSLFPYFDDVMKQSQFQSFQAMQNDTNLQDIKDMTKRLGTYGPVMLAHYKPDNNSQTTFDNDMRGFFTDAYLNEVKSYGLFAMSFMDQNNLKANTTTYNFIKSAITKYSASTAPTTPTTTTPSTAPTTSATTQKSTVRVFAQGTPAFNVYPDLQLVIKGNLVTTFKNISSYTTFTHEYAGSVTPKDIRLNYTNDGYDTNTKQDRNVRIDKISINGTEYQTEASNIYSVGSWNSTNGCQGGYKKSEWLHCAGYMQY